METVSVQVQRDHIERLCRVKKPILAIAELIWNGLDAEATEVNVHLHENKIGGLETVRVIDNGDGLPRQDAATAFGNLGGSWKKQTNRSKHGQRLIHGRMGKGRFRAFALGNVVEWKTRFLENGDLYEYEIIGKAMTPDRFEIGEPAACEGKRKGTTVEIRDIEKRFPSLSPPGAVQEITEYFAIYMSQYPDVKITYDGKNIDPSRIQLSTKDYQLSRIKIDNEKCIDAVLTIIEWAEQQTHRKLFLCDSNGFTLEDIQPGIQARGFNFTAYLKSDFIRELDDDNALGVAELHPQLGELLKVAKEKMREHFRQRAAEVAADVVEEWKRQDIYPYKGEAKNVIERAERQVFDICALELNAYLSGFEESDAKNKRIALRLLRHALESSPTAVGAILKELLDLPEEKQVELAKLLEKTSLEAIISASKTVADRLNFLRGLEILVFDQESKEKLLERRQLHRILCEHTWIFGEEYHLTVDDQSLTEVLKKHLSKIGGEIEIAEPVLKEDGSTGIIDLMLSRSLSSSRAGETEHLIVELKRPKIEVTSKEADQIIEYAFAVAEDERFRDTETRWVFWLVANEINNTVRRRAKQRNKPEGLLHDDETQRVFIWVKSWSQIIEDCKKRLEFFQEQLNYSADRNSAVAYLRETHAKYLPKCLQKTAS